MRNQGKELTINVIKFFLFSYILTGCHGDVNATNVESNLLKNLMKEYDKNTRPVLNQSQPVTLYFGIGYNELIEMDEKKQLLTSNVWVRQKWKDPWLTWNASNYEGITSINVDPKLIWKPDVMLHNSANDEDRGEMFLFQTPIIIYSDGTIYWYSPTKIKTSCKVDITYFPFDTQTCKLTFGLWTHHGSKVDIQFINGHEEADSKIFIENGEWELVSTKGKRNVITYSCCPEPYPDLTYYIQIKRRTLFYINNLIIPCILLALLAAASFLFPPETGERVALVITVLLGMTVFMLIFTEAIPPNSESQSLIGRYFGAILFELAFSLFMTCGILRLYHHNPDKEVPVWASKVVFGVLARIFGCGLCLRSQRLYTIKTLTTKPHKVHAGELKIKEVFENGDVHENQSNGVESKFSVAENSNPKEAKDVGMDTVYSYFETLQADKQRSQEWHALVKVLDTFFFWLFLLTIFVSSIAMLPVFGGQ